ncbi:hypothetical protein CEP52_002744 [Fusarium oligoseptatum]|uniref:Uncharacterized protein n=1 Tax=Fusarium oligoseptatum TaxID=2604345 RepID=A0A428UC32_9HYPO|nr:hypothetical protein CEP52_002744 [Fusarium oligoseptatum]
MTGIHLSASSFSKKIHPLRKHNYNIPISTMPAIIINRSVVFGAGINLAALSPAQLRAIFGGLAAGGGGPAAARAVRPNVGRRGRWRPAGHGQNRRRAARYRRRFGRNRRPGRGRVVRGPRLLEGVYPAPDPLPSMSNHVDFHEPAGLAMTYIWRRPFAEDSREVLAYLGVDHENASSWSEILLTLCVGLPMWEYLDSRWHAESRHFHQQYGEP